MIFPALTSENKKREIYLDPHEKPSLMSARYIIKESIYHVSLIASREIIEHHPSRFIEQLERRLDLYIKSKTFTPAKLCIEQVGQFFHTTPGKQLDVAWNGAVWFRLRELYPKIILLAYIRTNPMLRKRGLGTTALKVICDMADENGVEISLAVMPGGDPFDDLEVGPSYHDLGAWYKKHGFEFDMDGSLSMTRLPKKRS